jgi:small-conductance mechanosensitive channel
MKLSLKTCFLSILLSTLAVPLSFAQDSDDDLNIPQVTSLQSDWWTYFEGTRADVEPRIEAFLDNANSQISDLEPQNQEISASILEAVRGNLNVHLGLVDDADFLEQQVAMPAVIYSIADLMRLAGIARTARSDAAEEQFEVQREERILAGASRQRDLIFNDYVDATESDQRWTVGLRMLQARSAQAISMRRLELLTRRFDRATAYAQATAARVELAKERLSAAADDTTLGELATRIQGLATAVEQAREALRNAQIGASGLDMDTALGRSQERLQQQKFLGAEIGLALAETTLAQAQAERWWSELVQDAGPDIGALEAQILTWSEIVSSTAHSAPAWKQESENELLAVQSIRKDGLKPAPRLILDQRLSAARETLAKIGELDTGTNDLELLLQVVDNTAAKYKGAFQSWMTKISRAVKAGYNRVTDLADVTLFSVGDTPVQGEDILSVILIMTVAMLLSRGIRHAIRRVGGGELGGTQASLYTVGRLTHYAIIVMAIFIALSSIGLKFGNIALVAGALSVGIGFGLQSIVNNFVSGLIILFEHSLRVGDYIELDTGLTGTVKSINVRSTLINTNDNIDIVVPNSEFVTARLTNWTLGERTLRVRIPFGVAYGSDKDIVKKAALEAVAEVSYTLTHMKGREPDVWLVNFGDSSLDFLLLIWVNRQGARRPTRTRAAYLWALETKLTEYGIEIPFPQRDLHLRSGWPPAAKPAEAISEPDESE